MIHKKTKSCLVILTIPTTTQITYTVPYKSWNVIHTGKYFFSVVAPAPMDVMRHTPTCPTQRSALIQI